MVSEEEVSAHCSCLMQKSLKGTSIHLMTLLMTEFIQNSLPVDELNFSG